MGRESGAMAGIIEGAGRRDARAAHVGVLWVEFDTDEAPSQQARRQSRRAGTSEGIEGQAGDSLGELRGCPVGRGRGAGAGGLPAEGLASIRPGGPITPTVARIQSFVSASFGVSTTLAALNCFLAPL